MSVSVKRERAAGKLGRVIFPLLDALGWKGDKRMFLNAMPYDLNRLELDDLVNTIASLGFKVNKTSGTLRGLDGRMLPCLYLDRNQNPLVLLNFENGRFLGYDSWAAQFKEIQPNSEKGTFFFFEAMEDSISNLENPQQHWFSNIMTRFKGIGAVALFISFLLTFTTLMVPFIVMGIYSQIDTAESLTGFWGIGIGVLGLLLVDFFFRLFRYRIVTFLGARLDYLISTQVFRRILYFSPTSTENAPIGTQIIRMRDFASVRNFIEGPGLVALLELPFIIILFVGLVLMGGSLAYIPLVAAILLIIFSVIAMPFSRKATLEASEHVSKLQSFMIEFFTEFQAIRMSGLAHRWKRHFETLSANAALGSLASANISTVITCVSQGAVQLAGIVTIGMGVLGVLNGQYSSAVLIAAMLLVWKIMAPLTSGFSIFSQSIHIRKSIDQLNRFMVIPLEQTTSDMAEIRLRGPIEFKGVSLKYKQDYHPALLGIDLTIDTGEFAVIRGHDGAGKSSLLKLILGMYKPQAGKVAIDSFNIQQLAPTRLRRSIMYLPQEDTLFHVSIRQNLQYYSPTADDDDMEKALRAVGLWEEIQAMPDKLDSEIWKGRAEGDDVSLTRRLCLARALLNDADVVLLDEPTRGLQREDVVKLLDVLRAFKQSKTVILVSNNSVFLPLADKIVTLDMGKIVDVSVPATEEEDAPAGAKLMQDVVETPEVRSAGRQ
ncbi:peptidase domain-containing ABC transporter [Desulfovibrio sp. Fe33]|uniref:peptidase domain-containing ABC transporter n=1 Tax=Desulfovibrio sp. Fe33 TaxID=3020842 RepID=UPI00234D40DB|nr:ATP-binding cassette domain-containing protein [Desulfovibrio sp. Fe33]